MDMSAETLHLLTTVGGVAVTVGGVWASLRSLKEAFGEHVKADEKRHDEQEKAIQTHDRQLVRISTHLEITGMHRIAKKED